MTDPNVEPAMPNIAVVVSEFLQEKGRRLSAKRFSKYRQVLELFCIYVDGYWPGESQRAYDRITKAGGTFCTWFGPDRIPGGYSEFLGYYMLPQGPGLDGDKARGRHGYEGVRGMAGSQGIHPCGRTSRRAVSASLETTSGSRGRLSDSRSLGCPFPARSSVGRNRGSLLGRTRGIRQGLVGSSEQTPWCAAGPDSRSGTGNNHSQSGLGYRRCRCEDRSRLALG